MRSEPRVYVDSLPSGAFRLRAYVGTDSRGRPRFKSETVRGDQNEARARAKEIEVAMLRGEFAEESRETLGGYLTSYLKRLELGEHVERSTLEGYRTCFNRLPRGLRAKRLDVLKPRDFEQLYIDLSERGLAAASVTQCHRFFDVALKYAVVNEELKKNPLEGVKPPKVRRRRVLDDDEVGNGTAIPRDHAVAAIQSFRTPKGLQHRRPELFALFFTAYATGMRRGELLALQWRDVDLEGSRITVRRSLDWRRKSDEPRVKEPKTENGRRTIAITRSLVAVLREWREEARRVAKAAECELPKIVFFDLRTFSFLAPNMCTKAFADRLKAQGHSGTLHGLRHTHATELLIAREPVHIVSRRIGHSDVATTLRIYAHAIPGSDESVAERIEEVLELGAVLKE